MLPQTKRKGKAISIFALSFSVEWNLENFSGSAAVLSTLIVMCVCVRFGLRDSQLSALYRFLSDVSGWGTVHHRNTCANLSAHGADWQSVCPEACGKSEREGLRGKKADDGEKRKDEFAYGHPREAGYVIFCFFLTLNSRTTGPRSSYKVRLSFSTSSKECVIFYFRYYVHNKWWLCCMFVCGMLTHKLVLNYLDGVFTQFLYLAETKNHNPA